MNEELLNSVNENEVNEASEAPESAVKEEKTFTQDELNRIVESRVSRERKKLNGELYAAKENAEKLAKENGDLKAISEMLNESGVLTGTISEQIETLQREYGLSKKQAKAFVNGAQQPDETLELVKAKALTEDLTDEEAFEEYTRIEEIPEKYRTSEEKAKLKALSKKHDNTMFAREVREAEKYVNDTYSDVDFAKLIASEDFLEFAKGHTLPLIDVVKKYYKFSGAPDKRERPVSSGSVKSSGGAAVKDYYSPEEVDRLSPKDLDDPTIWAAVRKSMTKW